jgi:hypothetical protein
MVRILFVLLIPLNLLAQVGGESVYEFLNLPPSARSAALGGNLIATHDEDPDLAFHNPALLNKKMHGRIGLSTVAYLAGINYGYAGYVHHLDSAGITLNAGMQYMAYGTFQRADATGLKQGTFGAAENAYHIGASKQYDRLTYGASVKLITSRLDTYKSIGAAMDAGVTYQDTANQLVLSLVVKNLGTQITTYSENGEREPLPFDIQIGLSKQLEHLPFRFSVVYHDLHRFDIRYDDPNQIATTNLFGDPDKSSANKSYLVDKFFRHLIFGGELTISKNLVARLGYNYQRRQELTIDGRKGLTGFSMGVSVRINRFRIDYGRSTYHVAGASNHFSIGTNLAELF